MKVLIIENEFYLAQSISIRLSDFGFNCDIIGSYNEFNDEKFYDIVLLSTNTDNFLKAVSKFKESIVILLISYISTDTVSNPLKMGASDYIQKPFMIEELVRKIKHYQEFNRLQIMNLAYENYVKSKLHYVKLAEFNYKKVKLPLIIKTSNQNISDAFVYNYINECKKTLCYADLSLLNSTEKLLKTELKNSLLYLVNFHILNTTEQEKILAFIENKNVILHTNSTFETKFSVMAFDDDGRSVNYDEILTIDEYVKYVILRYQNVFSDTELSKKLGISRKSLWEKRKKYEVKRK